MKRIRKTGDVWTCAACGRQCPDQTAPHRGSCPCEVAGPGLGDMVAAGLDRIGITKERVSAALGKPCNCPQRQKALNEFGYRLGIGTPPPDSGPTR